jgi:hypothetical protein
VLIEAMKDLPSKLQNVVFHLLACGIGIQAVDNHILLFTSLLECNNEVQDEPNKAD